jgi:hypothetical protein
MIEDEAFDELWLDDIPEEYKEHFKDVGAGLSAKLKTPAWGATDSDFVLGGCLAIRIREFGGWIQGVLSRFQVSGMGDRVATAEELHETAVLKASFGACPFLVGNGGRFLV